jgi:nucleotide-binding universal stress UspA family protein
MLRFRRVLVPHDLSTHADRALRVAADLVGRTGEVLIVHAVVPVVPIADMAPGSGFYVPVDELVTMARHQLERVVQRVVGRRGPRTTIKVEIGDPYGRIVANARGMDAIVMPTVGRTGISHLVIGSVAEKVVRHSPVPVLTLRPEAARRGARRGAKTRRSASRRR